MVGGDEDGVFVFVLVLRVELELSLDDESLGVLL